MAGKQDSLERGAEGVERKIQEYIKPRICLFEGLSGGQQTKIWGHLCPNDLWVIAFF